MPRKSRNNFDNFIENDVAIEDQIEEPILTEEVKEVAEDIPVEELPLPKEEKRVDYINVDKAIGYTVTGIKKKKDVLEVELGRIHKLIISDSKIEFK